MAPDGQIKATRPTASGYVRAIEAAGAMAGAGRKYAVDPGPYFAVGSFFTPLSMNSIQNPWGSGTKKDRVVGLMNTGTSDLLSVCRLAALTRAIITSSSLEKNKKCAAPGS